MNYSKVLGMIGSEDNAESRKWYADFVLKGILKDMNITFWEGVKGQAILGSDDFTGEIRERFLAGKHSDPRAIVGLNELADKPFTMEGIARQVAAHFGIEEGDLYPRNAPFRLARSIFMELCCFYLSRKMTLSEIARRLGNVTVSAFSQNRRRLSSRMAEDAELRKHFEDIKKAL